MEKKTLNEDKIPKLINEGHRWLFFPIKEVNRIENRPSGFIY